MLKKAFSLVELMVTLIIVSILIAALSPVITKKLKSNTITVGSGASKELKMDCSKWEDCILCEENRCIYCGKTCLPSGQAMDSANCQCIDCATTFGATCLECAINTCLKCESTYYIKDKNCEICPIGSYCDGIYRKTCPEGTYTDTLGKTSCMDCPAGYSCSNGIKTACEAGTYSEANASSCTTCPKGYYCPGASDKLLCQGANYQPSTGQSSCLTCGAGNYVSSDRTSCITCPIGSYCTGNGSKVACATGAYQPSTGQSSCLTCSSKTAHCATCDVSTGVCETCATDYVLSGTSCVLACKCENGTCASGGTTCTSCNAGYYLTSGTCTYCPAGSFCTGGTAGKQSCTGCTCSWGGASSCTQSTLGNCSAGLCKEVDHTNCGQCTTCLSTYYVCGAGCCKKSS